MVGKDTFADQTIDYEQALREGLTVVATLLCVESEMSELLTSRNLKGRQNFFILHSNSIFYIHFF